MGDTNNMVFLDANTVYSYYGRKELGMNSTPVKEEALREFLNFRKDKSLPVSVLIEIITHFREKPEVLVNLIEFCVEKGILLYNNIPDYIVNPDSFNMLMLFKKNDMRVYAETILEKKIEIESKFTALFCMIIKELYAYYIFQYSKEFTAEQLINIYEFIANGNNPKYLITIIAKKLREGYKMHDEAKQLKEVFLEIIEDECSEIDMLYAMFSATIKDKKDILSEIQKGYTKRVQRVTQRENGTMKYIVDTLVKDKQFLHYSIERITGLLERGKYSLSQREYVKDVMFPAWLERGQKLQKNDIFDMLYWGCLDYNDKKEKNSILVDNNPYLITFDKRMKKYLASINPVNAKLSDTIQI